MTDMQRGWTPMLWGCLDAHPVFDQVQLPIFAGFRLLNTAQPLKTQDDRHQAANQTGLPNIGGQAAPFKGKAPARLQRQQSMRHFLDMLLSHKCLGTLERLVLCC